MLFLTLCVDLIPFQPVLNLSPGALWAQVSQKSYLCADNIGKKREQSTHRMPRTLRPDQKSVLLQALRIDVRGRAWAQAR